MGVPPRRGAHYHSRSIKSTRVLCVPIAVDEQVGTSWGKASAVAFATVDDGAIESWRTEAVSWDVSHDEGTPGSHHARVAVTSA